MSVLIYEKRKRIISRAPEYGVSKMLFSICFTEMIELIQINPFTCTHFIIYIYIYIHWVAQGCRKLKCEIRLNLILPQFNVSRLWFIHCIYKVNSQPMDVYVCVHLYTVGQKLNNGRSTNDLNKIVIFAKDAIELLSFPQIHVLNLLCRNLRLIHPFIHW